MAQSWEESVMLLRTELEKLVVAECRTLKDPTKPEKGFEEPRSETLRALAIATAKLAELSPHLKEAYARSRR